MKHLALVLWSCVLCAADPGVDFSDGTHVEGAVRLAPGAELRFHDGRALRVLDPATVSDIRLRPSSESLVRAFAMPEPGKAIRIETGAPYPLRELAVTVTFTDGSHRPGHLYLTKVLVAGDDEDQAVLIPAKQQGKPGQRLDQLVYPQRIVFAASTTPADGPTRLRLPITASEVGVASEADLAPLTATRHGDTWAIDPLLGSRAYIAARTAAGVRVGWPTDTSAEHAQVEAQVTGAIPAIRDYFEDKRLLAVHRRDEPDQVDSLMLLVRTGAGTDGAHRPWHVEIWRWRLDPDDPKHLLLAARVCLLRGRDAEDGVPAVQVDPGWWSSRMVGDELRVGEQP